ncbi:SET domain-containing protein [Rhodotorula sp. JG-1b]|nr:SET domain-containing protein [Rhodotorula sp. JG-1b]
MLARLAQRAVAAVASASSSASTKAQPQQIIDNANVQDSDTTMQAAAAGDDDDEEGLRQKVATAEAEEEEGSLESLENNNTDRDDGDAQPRTTAAAAPSEEEAQQPAQEEPDDPTRGKDGKQYLVTGIYYSASTAAYAASLRPTPSARSSTNRVKKKTETGTDWRSIAPSKSTAFPPPIFYGETLLEPPEKDDDSDDDDDDGIAARPFRLPFDILRDHWYAGSFDSTSTSTSRRRRSSKSKSQSQTKPTGVRGGDEKQRKDSSSSSTNPRPGKGGDKTTEEDILKREQSKKPPTYRYIGKNVYLGRGPDKAANPAICMCRPPARAHEMGCGQDCINRMMQYCCDPKLCPCGPDRCGNPPLSKREGVPVAKDGLVVIWTIPFFADNGGVGVGKQTGNRGFGLKTMRPIKKGEFVLEYRGEIISRNESYRRVLTDYKDSASYYFMDYDGFEVVDAGQRGNCARFINHSCGPNLEVVRWRLAQFEEYQMGLFALHDIPVGTELTYNYGWQDFSALAPKSTSTSTSSSTPATTTTTITTSAAVDSLSPAETIVLGNGTAIDPARQRCYCGAAECSGFLGSGGRKKSTSARVSTSNKPDSKKTTTAAAAATTTASAKVKGKRKADEEDDGPVVDGGEEIRPAPPPPRLAFAQAKIRVVDHAKTRQPPPTQPTQSASPPPPGAKKRRTSIATTGERTAAGARHLDEERDRIVGALRSGREAAKRAAGRLVGSLAPMARKGRASSGLGGDEGGGGEVSRHGVGVDSEEK